MPCLIVVKCNNQVIQSVHCDYELIRLPGIVTLIPKTTLDGASGGSSSTAAAAAAAAMKSDDEDEEEDGIKDVTTATSSVTFDRIEKVPVVSPFLEWQVIDESGDKDACPPLERVNRFINLIYRNLPAGVGPTTDGFANAKTTIPLPTAPQVAAAKKKPSIAAKAPKDAIKALVQVSANRSNPKFSEAAQQVNALFAKVCKTFLPENYMPDSDLPDNYMPDSDLMKLFWGALTEIISRVCALFHRQSTFQPANHSISGLSIVFGRSSR